MQNKDLAARACRVSEKSFLLSMFLFCGSRQVGKLPLFIYILFGFVIVCQFQHDAQLIVHFAMLCNNSTMCHVVQL